MPQAYSTVFARIYNQKWIDFANDAAPYLSHFYAETESAKTNRRVLDLCCGTGQLARHFLQFNYQVTGLDLSPGMLAEAVENNRPFVEAGLARFIQGDASSFSLDASFGLVLSTFDALNHLESEQALRDCFACVAAVNPGYFIFDLNTRRGLNNWDASFIAENNPEMTLLHQGDYNEKTRKATATYTGFVRDAEGRYTRFEESIFNLAFKMQSVRDWLLDAGWRKVHFARLEQLDKPIDLPEMESRVWFVCER